MSEIRTRVPKFSTRKVSIDVPDALVDIFTKEKVQEARERAGEIAHAASQRGLSLGEQISAISSEDMTRATKRARVATAPVIHKSVDTATRVASGAGKQTGPVIANLQGSASQLAGAVAENAPKVAAVAQKRGTEIAQRSRDEWLPAARKRLQDTQPVVEDAVRSRAKSMRHTASLARHSTEYGASSAKERMSRSARDAATATKRTTINLFSLVFWLGVVGWVLLLVFVPEKEKRQRLYAQVQDFISRYTG